MYISYVICSSLFCSYRHFDVIKTKTYGYFNGALHCLGRAELGSFWLISHWVGKLLTSSFMHSQPSLWAEAVFITASKAALLGLVLKLKQDNEDSEFVEVARKKDFLIWCLSYTYSMSSRWSPSRAEATAEAASPMPTWLHQT